MALSLLGVQIRIYGREVGSYRGTKDIQVGGTNVRFCQEGPS
jgi:hypothetical protein